MPENNKKSPIKRKIRRRNAGLKYLFLFAVVFLITLLSLSFLVKSYSPDVDVAIGNNEPFTLNDTDNDARTIDERLKWIQMEDELPTVAIRNPKEKTEIKSKNKEEINKQVQFNPEDIKQSESKYINKPEKKTENKENLDFKINNNNTPKPKPVPEPIVINNIPVSKPSKVYVGHFSSIEDAVRVQKKISSEESDIVPFTKFLNGGYVVQVGSFSDKEKAQSMVSRLQAKGYSAKIE